LSGNQIVRLRTELGKRIRAEQEERDRRREIRDADLKKRWWEKEVI
jgi:hypothetical protein